MVLETLSCFPRLFEKFKLPTRSDLQPYHSVIADDAEFGRLSHVISDEVRHCQEQIIEYVVVWVPFQPIWDVDKVEFMRLFNEENANTFDENITRHSETANNVQLQETISNVYFVDVNATKMKASVITHIDKWKELYLELLKTKAYDRITSRSRENIKKKNFAFMVMLTGIYDYTKENALAVLVIPTTILEMQNALELYQHLIEQLPLQETEFPKIKLQFIILGRPIFNY